MTDEPASGRERRRNARHISCVPVHIHDQDPGAPPHTALIRELSVSGAQILTRLKLEVGAHIDLDLYIRDTEHADAVSGRVVRVQPSSERGLWPLIVAIEFDTPLTRFEAEIEALAKKMEPIAAAKR